MYHSNEITYGDVIEVSWVDADNTKGIVCGVRSNEDNLIASVDLLTIHGPDWVEADQIVKVHSNALIGLGVQ